MPIRYFFAVTPPDPLRDAIEAFRGKWGHPHHRVEPHITVKAPFEWPGDPAPVLKAAAEAAGRFRPFEVALGEPGRFERARVLFLTVQSEGLEPLHQAAVEALKPLVPVRPGSHEGGAYHPHLTLAAGRFGIDEAGIAAMEQDARVALGGLPAWANTALRCYRLEPGQPRWQVFRDLPVGLV